MIVTGIRLGNYVNIVEFQVHVVIKLNTRCIYAFQDMICPHILGDMQNTSMRKLTHTEQWHLISAK